MIVFDLKCLPTGHVFEAWFRSTGDYEAQRDQGFVECPICGAAQVEKAATAARLGAKSNQGPSIALAHAEDKNVKAKLGQIAALQKKVLEGADYVGERFASEARAIHVGDAIERPIYGRATPAEKDSLADEGIAIFPLPFPVCEPGQEN